MTWTVKMADARYDGYEEGFDEGREAGLQVGIQQGIERGAYETKLETARNMLIEGLTPQMVARCTGLPLETVMELVQTE